MGRKGRGDSISRFQNYFIKEFDEVVARTYDTNPQLASWYFSDEKLKNEVVQKAAELYYKWAQENNLPPITKTTPSENRMRFRQTVFRCKEYIHWIDRYFDIDALDFLMTGIDKENVREVRILTSLYQNGLTKELYERFKTFTDVMQKRIIDIGKVVSYAYR